MVLYLIILIKTIQMNFWEFSSIKRRNDKLERIRIYNTHPSKCNRCNSAMCYEKRHRKYCSRKCSNINNDGKKKKGNYLLDSLNWQEIQKSYDEGVLIKDLCKMYNFSQTLLLKANKKGYFKNEHNILHKNKISNKLSESLKECHRIGKHSGWNAINSQTKRSHPEEFFYNVLKKNGLFEKYTIIEKMPFLKYTLDFVIVDLKLDIEIDGKQHFITESAIEHDKQRNETLIKNGWKVYRIAWIEMVNNPHIQINEFLKYIDNIHTQTNRFYDILEVRGKIKVRKHKNQKEYFDNIRENSLKINKPKIQLILNSNIDFSKFGWVKKVSNIIRIQEQRVNKWMKKNMLDFYNEKCFKRSVDESTKLEKIKLVKNSKIDFTKKGWKGKLSKLVDRADSSRWLKTNMPDLYSIRYTQR